MRLTGLSYPSLTSIQIFCITMAPKLQTDPRYILPAGSNSCPVNTCKRYGIICNRHWDLNYHMKTVHDWPTGFTQPHTDRRLKGHTHARAVVAPAAAAVAANTSSPVATSSNARTSEDNGDSVEDGDSGQEGEVEEDEEAEEEEEEMPRGPTKSSSTPAHTSQSVQENDFVWLMRTVRPMLEASQSPSAPFWLAEIDYFQERPEMFLRIIGGVPSPSHSVRRLFRLGNALEDFRMGRQLPEPAPITLRLISSNDIART